MKQPNPNSGEGRMHAVHRKRLELIRDEAAQAAGVALRIANTISEVLARGGTANIQPQVNALTSAYARLAKDWGVVEQLQEQGVRHRPSAGCTS